MHGDARNSTMRFLLIDRVLAFEPDRRLLAIKNVAMESQYLEYHFPQAPVFPGVLIIEAMAQASGYFITRSIEELDGGRMVFAMMTAANTRFIKLVRPGDQLRIEVELTARDSSMARTRTTALVDEKVVSRGDLRFVLIEERGGEEAEGYLRHFEMLRRVLERSATDK
jgi:3-hydroxyacyl-[acyl-carrier-protein] dehydratase